MQTLHVTDIVYTSLDFRKKSSLLIFAFVLIKFEKYSVSAKIEAVYHINAVLFCNCGTLSKTS